VSLKLHRDGPVVIRRKEYDQTTVDLILSGSIGATLFDCISRFVFFYIAFSYRIPFMKEEFLL